MKTRDKL